MGSAIGGKAGKGSPEHESGARQGHVTDTGVGHTFETYETLTSHRCLIISVKPLGSWPSGLHYLHHRCGYWIASVNLQTT